VAYHAIAGSPGLAGGGGRVRGRGPDEVRAAPVDCTGVEPTEEDQGYLCDNWRLGPKELPTNGSVAGMVKGYDRLGGEKTPKAFLDKS
jgi:hypothetical protein